jgi:hypothetical protein
MSDQTPLDNPQAGPNDPPDYSSRDERRRLRHEAREARWARRGGGWFGGAVLILLGLIFLAQNVGFLPTRNWWALFILIPAAGGFAAAWNRYQDSGGQIDAAVRGSLFGGIVMALIAFAFLFNLTSALFWPALLILVGAGVLVNAMWR